MLLGIKHDMYCLVNKRNDNVSFHSNTDDECEDLKMVYYIAKVKLMEDTRDTRTATLETSISIMKDKDTLNTCKNVLRRARAKCDAMKNEISKEGGNDNEEQGSAIDARDDEALLEKFHKTESICEPCT